MFLVLSALIPFALTPANLAPAVLTDPNSSAWSSGPADPHLRTAPTGAVSDRAHKFVLSENSAPADEAEWLLCQDATSSIPSLQDTRKALELKMTLTLNGISRFVASEHFRQDVSSNAAVKILWIGDTFRRRFMDKIEEHVAHGRLSVHRVRETSAHGLILSELGNRHETQLGHLWEMLNRQPSGENGPLVTNSSPNIFYIRDSRDILWAVDAVWGGSGWEIGASSTESALAQRDDGQVFSR